MTTDPRDSTHAKQYTLALREKEALTALKESPGWALVRDWLDATLARLRHDYETSGPITEGNMYINEYRRAQINMLRSLQDIPDALLAVAQDAIDLIRANNPEEMTDGTD